MALVITGQLQTLAAKIIDSVAYVPPATASGRYAMTTEGRTVSIEKMTNYLNFVMTYVSGDKTKTPGSDDYKGFLEIGGGSGADNLAIALDDGQRVIEAYAAGVGSNHVAPMFPPPEPLPIDMNAATPLYPVTGAVVDTKLAVGTQSNGGRGLVK